MSKIPTAVRSAVHERDDRRCARCGTGRGLQVSHRIRRREGGHRLSNVNLLCSDCHLVWAHLHPREAMAQGVLLSAVADVDPCTEPMLTWRGWVLLDDDGGLEVIAPRYSTKPATGA